MLFERGVETVPDDITAYPLCWPVDQPRAPRRTRANFGRKKGDSYGLRRISIAEARDEVLREVRLMEGQRVTISSNLELRRDGLPYSGQRQPNDPGIAVYFFRRGRPYALACDAWDTVEANLYAIALHIDALRGQERWGVGTLEQRMRGYELPSSARVEGWHEVLGVSREASLEMIQAAYRDLTRQHHPDRGGDAQRMAAINAAWAQARIARGTNA